MSLTYKQIDSLSTTTTTTIINDLVFEPTPSALLIDWPGGTRMIVSVAPPGLVLTNPAVLTLEPQCYPTEHLAK